MIRWLLVVLMLMSVAVAGTTTTCEINPDDCAIVQPTYRADIVPLLPYYGWPNDEFGSTAALKFDCGICGQVWSRVSDRSDEVCGMFLCPHCTEQYGPGIQKAVDALVTQAKAQEADRIAERKERERQVKICEIEDRLREIEAERTKLAGKLSALKKE